MFDFEHTFYLPVRSLPRNVKGLAAVPFKPPDPGSAVMHADPTDAFDLWLSRDLHRLYSAIAAEPIPPGLLRLLDGHSKETEARATGPPSPRERGTGMPGRPPGFEQRVRERAYFLWLDEGRPRGRAAEHWRLATILQIDHEVDEASAVGTA